MPWAVSPQLALGGVPTAHKTKLHLSATKWRTTLSHKLLKRFSIKRHEIRSASKLPTADFSFNRKEFF